MSDYIVTIDMGGTKILGALVNSKEGIAATTKKSTKVTKGKPGYPLALHETVQKLIAENGIKESQIKAICLGVPGFVDPPSGVIGMAPNLGLKNYHIKKELQKYTKLPVIIENDVNLAALGVLHFDKAKGKKNVLVVYVGTGIGGGLIFNGSVYRGAHNFAGEIGHITYDVTGPVCGCGKKGCFEAFASRTAMVRDIVNDIKKNKKRSLLSKQVKDGIQIKSKILSQALEAEDKVAVKHVSNACHIIGKVLADLNNLLNLEMIVLGGGAIEAGHKFMMPLIRESFKQYSLPFVGSHVKVVNSALGDDAALLGGIPLAHEFLGIKV